MVMFFLRILILCAGLANLTCPLAWGQTSISPQLLIQTNDEVTFPGWYFPVGLFQESLRGSAKHRYEASGMGISLGAFQHIRPGWTGGLELRWSDWRAAAEETEDVSPLSIFSKVEYTPWLKEESRETLVRPYVTGGLGYMALFNERSWTAGRSQSSFGETAATWGGGLQLVGNQAWGLKLGVEMCRGLATDNYMSLAYMFQFIVGQM